MAQKAAIFQHLDGIGKNMMSICVKSFVVIYYMPVFFMNSLAYKECHKINLDRTNTMDTIVLDERTSFLENVSFIKREMII